MENLALYAELLEASSNANKAFIKSEMALNDGNVEDCQKFSKEGQVLVRALMKDTFIEIEELGENDGSTNDYDYPNNFELIKSLNEIAVNVGSLIASIDDENVTKICLPSLFKAINTTKEIYSALFEN
ncbi:MAG: hypothetical protein HFI85_02435 [Clostridia bacterium]|jgi:hypothetical protein|nr:hypothetical protein [Clostridia bacterium]